MIMASLLGVSDVFQNGFKDNTKYCSFSCVAYGEIRDRGNDRASGEKRERERYGGDSG